MPYLFLIFHGILLSFFTNIVKTSKTRMGICLLVKRDANENKSGIK